MKLIVDLDHLTYRSAASCSPTKLKPFQEPVEEAIWRFESMFAQIQLDLNSNEYELYMSGEGNWRYDIYPAYKANRKNVPKPMWLENVREHALLKYKAEICNGKEADDACGIRLTQEGLNAICVSLDKDLLTVPGYHYNFVKKERKLVSPYDALRNFYRQVITGDGSDNVPAYDGMFRSKQPLFIERILQPLDEMTEELEMWEYALSLYENPELAKRNAAVLYIQRKEEDAWKEPSKRMV